MYSIVTYSRNYGSDEFGCYVRKADARKDARRYKKDWEYVAIYNDKTRSATVVYGDHDRAVFAPWVTITGAKRA